MTKIPSHISTAPGSKTTCQSVANRIADLVRRKPDAVLGLATGNTMIGVYAELVRLHCKEGLDFSRVTTFNLDEYYPIKPDAPQSFARFMKQHLFSQIKFRASHVPDGTLGHKEDLAKRCAAYDKAIEQAGGIDLQVLGLGLNGHIGYHEPGSWRHSRTRIVTLNQITREGISGFTTANEPEKGITMGIATIMRRGKSSWWRPGQPRRLPC